MSYTNMIEDLLEASLKRITSEERPSNAKDNSPAQPEEPAGKRTPKETEGPQMPRPAPEQ